MTRNAKAPRRLDILGRAPVLDGESETSYWELHEHMFGALEPADIVDEIRVRDAVDVAWNIKRLRHTLSTILSAKITAAITRKASSLVEAGPELNSGTEEQRQEMAKLLNPNSPVYLASPEGAVSASSCKIRRTLGGCAANTQSG